MNFNAPVTQVLLKIDKPLQDSLITDSGLKFYISPDYKKEWQATVTATVVELPIKVNPKDKSILEKLYPGDEICVSYRVVADFDFGSDSHRFIECTEPNDYVKDYRNGKGERVSVYALPKRSGLTHIPEWVGIYQDKYGEIISGEQGTEDAISRWQSQFQFGKTDDYKFNNFFEYDKKDYWKCDPSEIFAKRVKGHLIAIGNRIICKPIDEDIPAELLPNIRHNDSVKLRYTDRARVLSSPNKNFKKDEVVAFNPTKMERYDFFGKQYYLIREDLVLGKWHVA